MEGVIPNIDELFRNLRHQVDLYKRLIDVLRDERQHIVTFKCRELRDATFSKEAIIDEIQREESRRTKWMQDAAKVLSVEVKDVTLEMIAGKFAREHYEPLITLKNLLLMLLKKTKEFNEDNRALVEMALKDTQEMKKNILGMTTEKPQVYGPKGSMGQGRETTSRILNKEA